MFLESKYFLTIWDIARRWAGYDADATDPLSLPEDVKYWIHKVILGYFSKDLTLRRKSGRRVGLNTRSGRKSLTGFLLWRDWL